MFRRSLAGEPAFAALAACRFGASLASGRIAVAVEVELTVLLEACDDLVVEAAGEEEDIVPSRNTKSLGRLAGEAALAFWLGSTGWLHLLGSTS
jgi:NAD(P)H-hydrate repair Nnr-like enzyme with NAD(P)H-hydrate dehydratase domain